LNLHELVVKAAARYPDRIAVVGPSSWVRYRELDRMANGLARRLIELGAGPGDRIIVWDDKSIAAVAAMQAVLRVGAAYIPADEAIPPARIVKIVEDGAVQVVCAGRDRIDQLARDLPSFTRSLDLAAPASMTAAPVSALVSPDDLAYILYTSGSTGAPKGVCVSHRNARAFVDWAVTTLGVGPEDRFANHAPLTFDLSVLDLYAAFSAGATVCLIPRELGYAPAQLVEFLHSQRITVWYSVPSALILMMRDGGMLARPAPASLRAVLFAGEPLPIGHVRELRAWTGARLFNLYGPTETNVCTSHEVVPADLQRDRPVPIGKAVCGDAVWAEKPDRTIAAPGDEGELVVTGPTVMPGYWGYGPHRGPYRTGDIVRVLADGSFDYVGRHDHMVKVRGHRIEPGEVETVLAAHPEVAQAAVVVHGAGVDARLTAFIVARPGSTPSVLSLKRHSAEHLPRYMIADEVHLVPYLPQTPNGKTDRLALATTPRPDSALAHQRRS